MKLYLFGDLVITLIFRVICYGVGRAVIAGFTFGRIRSENFKDTDRFERHGIGKDADGTYILSAEVTALIGFVLLVLLSVLGLILYKGTR